MGCRNVCDCEIEAIKGVTDEMLIKTYNKIGNKYFGKGDHAQLIEWGNSEEDIRQIKIKSVKCDIKFYQNGINTYKILNELNGGKNI